MSESLLIDFEEAGRLLGGLHPNTLRQRKGGTENLTHVSGFGRRVMLVREEVNALVESKIAQARGADVPMANHPDFQDDLAKLEKLSARKTGEPNPFVLGWPAQARIFTIQSECALAARAKVREKR